MSKGKRIPRAEALRRIEPLLERLPEAHFLAGSLARGAPTVRDADIIVRRDEFEPSMVAGFDILAQGERKVRVLVAGFQADIVLADRDQIGAARLYLTGPHGFNVKMRAFAKGLGLKLNEYGLWRGDECVESRSDRLIFRALGLAYIPPEQRTDDVAFEALGAEVQVEVTGDSGKPYKVYRRQGIWSCSCPSFVFCQKRPKTCKHIKRVQRQQEAA